MVKKYENDPIKAKARERIYSFADSHLPKDRSSSTALYLASTNEGESLLLDKLGISRANRIILEGDKSLVQDVRKMNPGVKVIPTMTTEFFKSGEAKKYGPFSYCGLDYECMLNDDVLGDLRNIAWKGLLEDEGIIYTNLVANREQTNQKGEYVSKLFELLGDDKRYLNKIFDNGFDYFLEISKIHKQLEREGVVDELMSQAKPGRIFYMIEDELNRESHRRLSSFISKPNLNILRSLAVTSSVISSLAVGEIMRPYFALTNCPKSIEVINNYGGGKFDTKKFDTVTSKKHVVMRSIEELFESVFEASGDLEKGYQDRNALMLLESNAQDYFTKSGLGVIPRLAVLRGAKGYSVKNNTPLSYVSTLNTHMMLDIMHVKSLEKIVNGAIDALIKNNFWLYITMGGVYLSKIDGSKKKISSSKLRKIKDLSKRYATWLGKQASDLNSNSNIYKNTRKNIGSAFRQPLTLALARKCIINGLTDEQIAEQYQVGDNWGRIAALRAHRTRGNIGQDEEKSQNEPKNKKPYVSVPQPPSLATKLIPRNAYRALQPEQKLRLDYFLDEVIEPLHHRRERSVREAFSKSNLKRLVNPSIDPIRFYAFFDDVTLAVKRGDKISPEFINSAYLHVRDAKHLTTVVKYKQAKSVKTQASKPKTQTRKKSPSQSIKDEVRGLIQEGNNKEDIWDLYKDNFSSRQQFGAVIAWASPNLAIKIKK